MKTTDLDTADLVYFIETALHQMMCGRANQLQHRNKISALWALF